MSKLRKIAENPWLNLTSGAILLITSGHDILKSLDGDIGTHHGVAIFGLVQILQCLPDILEGAEHVIKLEE